MDSSRETSGETRHEPDEDFVLEDEISSLMDTTSTSTLRNAQDDKARIREGWMEIIEHWGSLFERWCLEGPDVPDSAGVPAELYGGVWVGCTWLTATTVVGDDSVFLTILCNP